LPAKAIALDLWLVISAQETGHTFGYPFGNAVANGVDVDAECELVVGHALPEAEEVVAGFERWAILRCFDGLLRCLRPLGVFLFRS
jgi:hypothetical protein